MIKGFSKARINEEFIQTMAQEYYTLADDYYNGRLTDEEAGAVIERMEGNRLNIPAELRQYTRDYLIDTYGEGDDVVVTNENAREDSIKSSLAEFYAGGINAMVALAAYAEVYDREADGPSLDIVKQSIGVE